MTDKLPNINCKEESVCGEDMSVTFVQENVTVNVFQNDLKW